MHVVMTPAACEVHVWHFDLRDARWDAAAHVLDAASRFAAARLRDALLRRRYLRRWSAIRTVLARYTPFPAGTLEIRRGPFGKPEIDGGIEFNVSHRGDAAVLAVARDCIGIDIECFDDIRVDMDEIADVICHRDEQACADSFAPAQRHEFLQRLWVRKEAYLKALGCGIRHGLSHVRVMDEAQNLVHDDANGSDEPRFHLRELSMRAGWKGCVCTPFVATRIVTQNVSATQLGTASAHVAAASRSKFGTF